MIPSSVRIFVCTEPQDMRRSFDGLSLAATEHIKEDPQSGALFEFVNKRANRVKVLWYDTNGYCLLYKRLHRARFMLPESETIDTKELATLLRGVMTSKNSARLT